MAIVAGASGALHSATGHRAGQPAQEDGYAHKRARCLDVRRQRQQRVISLALHVPCGLVDAVHPDALPDDLRSEDVGPDEGRDLPLGQRGHGDSHHPSSDGAGEADELHPCIHHDATVSVPPVGPQPGRHFFLLLHFQLGLLVRFLFAPLSTKCSSGYTPCPPFRSSYRTLLS